MTPATIALDKAKIDYQLLEYQHETGNAFGLEAAQKLNLAVELVFKTLVAELDTGKLVVAIIPVAQKLNMKQLAKAAGAKKAAMASPDKVQRSTGYVLGGVSPVGQKKPLATFIDASAAELKTIYVSGGRRGLDIALAPADLAQITRAKPVPLTQG
ncbi:Cys-tRNA(Pro) deacylase [Shewanella sp. AS1]|uniref:Cys-tRNA(Pro) deacylase n=1 Tax=Shewanella sp. AS1 TaxID=2907626 RepID=UPI001F38A566|nr:Cys-tRNA(Pro) deacylase [Shewanella sp. AS1]MCE9679669.1 Cys-tRNA(Pro) deacylase [Shewanella sp. AS1]